MTKRKNLETAVANAEALLKHAVKELADGGGFRNNATENIEKARANCREARAALTKLERAEP